MPVGVEGESGAVMTQQTGERFHIHTVLERERSECVPIEYNREQSEKPSKINGLTALKCSFSHEI